METQHSEQRVRRKRPAKQSARTRCQERMDRFVSTKWGSITDAFRNGLILHEFSVRDGIACGFIIHGSDPDKWALRMFSGRAGFRECEFPMSGQQVLDYKTVPQEDFAAGRPPHVSVDDDAYMLFDKRPAKARH